MPPRKARSTRPRAGFSLLELLVVSVVVTVGVLGYTRAILQTRCAERTSQEALKVTNVASSILEEMAGVEFSELYARYNGTAADDPADGKSPGATFPVDGLTDGRAAATCVLVFPEVGGPGQLREDSELKALGLPRDLNGDGAIDSGDHSADYILLPVLVRVEWTGVSRSRVEIKAIFSER